MKNAKKSMFITTILMVAVLIVAVSTATFAWYTTTTGVQAEQAVVNSASSDSADIGIDWTANLSTTKTSINLDSDKKILPMVPTAEIAAGAPAIEFETAPIDLEGKFTADGTTTTPWSIVHKEGDPEQTYTSFYVINKNYNEPVTVKMTAEFAAGADIDLSNSLCVAVFADDKVVGVFANKDYKVGEITATQENGDLADCAYKVAPSTGIVLPEIAKRSAVKITIYAWINGDDLASANANKEVATFSFNFAENV